MNQLLKTIKKFFFSPKLSREAYHAYINKLPDEVSVNWERDGDSIIGEVIAEDNKFITQGKSSEDFVEMVNDALFTVYEIPQDYIDVIRLKKTFNPSTEEREKLNDLQIRGNKIKINKRRIMQTA